MTIQDFSDDSGFIDVYETPENIYEEIVIDDDIPVADQVDEIGVVSKDLSTESLVVEFEDLNVETYIGLGMAAAGSVAMITIMILGVISIIRKG